CVRRERRGQGPRRLATLQSPNAVRRGPARSTPVTQRLEDPWEAVLPFRAAACRRTPRRITPFLTPHSSTDNPPALIYANNVGDVSHRCQSAPHAKGDTHERYHSTRLPCPAQRHV